MRSAKPSSSDAPAHRRSQPFRQTRTNPPRSSANPARSAAASAGRDSSTNAGPSGNQPIDIFPAITHFADTITALPKELVRHFTLLKEVDAKLFAPEDQLCKLVQAAAKAPLPEPRANYGTSSVTASGTASMTAQNSSAGPATSQLAQPPPPTDEANATAPSVFDPSNIPRRQLFRQTALKIQEMLGSLEEKNHVISTANEALQRQLARVEDVWPYLENEFSNEAKWGSTSHWAYPENRSNPRPKPQQTAARSDARKQAVQAKRNQKTQPHDSEADDHDGRQKGEGSKKSHNSKTRKTAESNVGLGISGAPNTNGNPPQKRRKVEKPTNGATGGAAMERAMSGVPGNNAPTAKTNSPRGTPVPDGLKKRKALPSSGGQSKKKNGAPRISPSMTSSPVLSALPESKAHVPVSPVPGNAPRPASSRARKNSLQSNADGGKARAPPSAPIKPNGVAPADLALPSLFPRPGVETRVSKESSAPVKPELAKNEGDRAEGSAASATGTSKKDGKADEPERKSESLPPQPQATATVTTKSGRGGKTSTPALANAQEPARPRSSRNADTGGGSKKSQKKSNPTLPPLAPHAAKVAANGTVSRDDEEEGEIDADEPTYCYCNSVSYGEMVACDADGCEREWFHLACVGLKVAPGSRSKHAMIDPSPNDEMRPS
ncbi:PHD finger domain protein [Ophiocordyceps sinensis CO18]|uniref:PHD finger domain protein n=1 Tax=Ophiocordyceps sinensis (strain Co18 / CGMCC 3.14243) TaxID=911162 RepID=T5ABP2_OPHSC|nr:PHD finger domain protein [Ophiocordyceps sinensis CO18]